MSHPKLDKVYGAASQGEQEATYDDWADGYDRELAAMGYASPLYAAAVFARHVAPDAGPVLDAGCGTGLQCAPLKAMGYGPITGLDLSQGMLDAARAKGIYDRLVKGAMGDGMAGFRDDAFAAVLSVGTITPGHAPPESFDDLVRLTRPGGQVVFTLRSDPGQDPAYPAALDRLAADGRWRHVFTSGDFVAMPYGEPEVRSVIHVYTPL